MIDLEILGMMIFDVALLIFVTYSVMVLKEPKIGFGFWLFVGLFYIIQIIIFVYLFHLLGFY